MEVLACFDNYGDAGLNKRIASEVGFEAEYKSGQDVFDHQHGYLLYNRQRELSKTPFRCCYNVFLEKEPYIIFVTP